MISPKELAVSLNLCFNFFKLVEELIGIEVRLRDHLTGYLLYAESELLLYDLDRLEQRK
jgi:hypothetical protein